MKPHDEIDDHLEELAIEHVLRHPAADAGDDFTLHLGGCARCRAEVDALRAEIAALGFLAPERAPKSDLLARLIGAQPWKSWAEERPAAATFVGDATNDWERTAFAGVFARRLFVDRERDQVTMLVRMDPGSAYPAHTHGGPETCYVVSGDLTIGPLAMKAGDFQRCEMGSEHPVQATNDGCLLLITSSLHDQLHEG
jgi:quercetin dioxygenase-like cupin family protein